MFAVMFARFCQSKLFPYVLELLLIIGILFGAWYEGGQHVQKQWDEANLKTQAQIDELKAKAAAVTTKVVTEYVDRVRTITVKGDTITQYVDRVITPDEDKGCTIPKNAILLMDSAAMNEVPADTPSASAVPVTGGTKK